MYSELPKFTTPAVLLRDHQRLSVTTILLFKAHRLNYTHETTLNPPKSDWYIIESVDRDCCKSIPAETVRAAAVSTWAISLGYGALDMGPMFVGFVCQHTPLPHKARKRSGSAVMPEV